MAATNHSRMKNKPMADYEFADLYCGGGGSSTGGINAILKRGLNPVVRAAVNHWPLAAATYKANYPWANVLPPDELENLDPKKVVPSRKLNLLMASPECTHFSNARGAEPMSYQSRTSARYVLRWLTNLDVDDIFIENVREFMTWGPLTAGQRPNTKQKGKDFLIFLRDIESLGYTVDYRILNAANYGDPTTRERLFIMARKHKAIQWPEPTHCKPGQEGLFGTCETWRPARDIIDWTIESQSIFDRKKPLVENTMKRIMAGIKKFSGSTGEPFLTEYHGSSYEGGERLADLDQPMPTIATSNQYGLVEPFVVALNHGKDARRSYSMDAPTPTITSVDAWGYIEPMLINYNGTGHAHSLDEPVPTITSKDRFGIVIPLKDGGEALMDIKFRMLQPHELAKAMSFPDGYKFAGNRRERVKQIGNAVACKTAESLVWSLL